MAKLSRGGGLTKCQPFKGIYPEILNRIEPFLSEEIPAAMFLDLEGLQLHAGLLICFISSSRWWQMNIQNR